MKTITIKSILFILITISIKTPFFAQYKAIELGVTASQYIDDNMDREYDYKSYSQPALNHYMLGYSFPISSKILLTPRVGVSWTDAQYRTNNILSDTQTPVPIPTSSVVKDKEFIFANTSISGSYWLKSDYTGLFFTGDLWAIVPIYAQSNTSISELIESSMGMSYELELINNDIKDQMQSIIPIMSIGVGYNLKIAYGAHIFANMNLDYRPTGYFKNTENITHINRRLTLGLKYVIKKEDPINNDKTSF